MNGISSEMRDGGGDRCIGGDGGAGNNRAARDLRHPVMRQRSVKDHARLGLRGVVEAGRASLHCLSHAPHSAAMLNKYGVHFTLQSPPERATLRRVR
jgi:hypothetical protein